MQRFEELMHHFFGHQPTTSQQKLFQGLSNFTFHSEKRKVLIISGYAGTGKTTLIGAYTQALNQYKIPVILLAPTGRAAKIFSQKAKQKAYTIHKVIYRLKSKTNPYSGLSLAPNFHKNTIFLVDEASMIGDYTMTNGDISNNNLLEDLFEFVYSGKNCQLILIGDEGQLPPVGSDFSPALNKEYLGNFFPLIHFEQYQLTEVLRQKNDSDILKNATLIRSIENQKPKLSISYQEKNGSIISVYGNELQDYLESSYSNFGMEETVIITRSNKQANLYNQHIRSRILWHEEEISSGDILMCVKNNYFWIKENTDMGFIANGELFKVIRVLKEVELYGFRFVHLSVQFLDYDEMGEVEIIAHLETLQVESPALKRERMKELFFEIEKDYSYISQKKKRYEAILSSPYFNAVQIKYAYAVTCHKSQGGQWADVYIDPGYINLNEWSKAENRWLYTAITRATNRIFLINFPSELLSNKEED